MITIEPITWNSVLYTICIIIGISIFFYVLMKLSLWLVLKEFENILNKKSNNLKKEENGKNN